MTNASTNVIAKIAAVVAGLGLVAMSFASFAPVAKAATQAELEAQIAALMAQIAAMGGGSSASMTFTMDLTIGSTGAEVTALQNFLISGGYSIPAGATGYFGAQTQAALAAYQAANGISPAAGYFGPITRAKVNSMGGGSTGGSTGGGSTGGGLSGGAGSVDDYSLVSGLSDEEVGEDEEDVEVAGLEIEADDGSDLEFTAVRLVFVGGADAALEDGTDNDHNDNFDEYAEEVSVWLDGEEVARVDADEFDEDNDYTQTVSLEDAVLESGETGELTVGITGAGGLDSADVDDEWSVDFRQVRFEDADGATISEDPTTAPVVFQFQSFAAAADTNFKITAGENDEEVNDAHVIDVDDSDDTEADLLSFNVEIGGDSDVVLDALPVNFDVTGAANVDDMVNSLSLMMGGDEVGTASVGSDCIEDADCSAVGADETYLFDDMDLTLEAGEEYEFTVVVELKSTADVDLDAGDTIAASFGETQTDLTNFDAEDEAGDDLADSDTNGTVVGEASAVYDSGIMVTLVSTDAEITHEGDPAGTNDHDQGTFTIVFDVTAFGADAFVDNTAPDASGGATETDLDVTGTLGTLTGTIESAADEGTDGFVVEEDETERFTITAHIIPGADGFFDVAVGAGGILYGLTDENTDGDTVYTFNLDDFQTEQLFLNFDT